MNDGLSNSLRTAFDSAHIGNLGYLPPQDIAMERVVIGAAMLEKVSCKIVLEIMLEEDFYKPEHQLIFAAMMDLAKQGTSIDMRTVVSQLRKNNNLETAGGQHGVLELTSAVSKGGEEIKDHCIFLKQHSIKRQLIHLGMKLQADGYKDDTDSLELLEEGQNGIHAITGKLPKKGENTMKELMIKLTNIISTRAESNYSLTGVPSGFPKVDKITQGWQNSDLIIIAARPGMGKSAFIVQCLLNAAIDFKIPVAMFSLEMSSLQLIQRATSIQTSMPLQDIRSKRFDDLDWINYNTKISSLVGAPIYIDDTAALRILELRAKCRRLVAEHGVKLIVIDYLQLMRGDTSAKGNREQEISSISQALKAIAKELNVPVIALSQLSRAVETRGGSKKPLLSDLRESGSIEQDADVVVFLWRPDYYKVTDDNIGTFIPGATEVDFAKHRNGATDKTFIQFIATLTKFQHVDWPYEYTAQNPKPLESENPPALKAWTESKETFVQPSNDDMPF
jgi:replicative DNA helicase